MSASADVLAMAKVEVDLASIPEGKNVRIPTTKPPWRRTGLDWAQPIPADDEQARMER